MSQVVTSGPWAGIFENEAERARVEARLAEALPTLRWFRGKSRPIAAVALFDIARVPFSGGQGAEDDDARLLFLAVTHDDHGAEQTPELYVLPVAFAHGDEALRIRDGSSSSVLFELQARGVQGILVDATARPSFLLALLARVADATPLVTLRGSVQGATLHAYARTPGEGSAAATPRVLRGEQTNTSIVYGTTFILKLLRKLDDGVSADLEVSRFLTDVAGYANTPAVAGSLSYAAHSGTPSTLAILQRFVPNSGDAWAFTKGALTRYLDDPSGDSRGDLVGYLPLVRTLGKRTAEMHRALASRSDVPAFAPEPLGAADRHPLVAAVTAALGRVLTALRSRERDLAPETRRRVLDLTSLEGALEARIGALATLTTNVVRTRIHGDFHLGQVLVTGDDVTIIDFEGEPSRTAEERRAKRSPLADVAGMLRSLHYAAMSALVPGAREGVTEETAARARAWYEVAKAGYLEAYFVTLGDSPIAPPPGAARDAMVDFYLLEKCIYEIGYEMNNRPDWLPIPLEGLLGLVGGAGA